MIFTIFTHFFFLNMSADPLALSCGPLENPCIVLHECAGLQQQPVARARQCVCERIYAKLFELVCIFFFCVRIFTRPWCLIKYHQGLFTRRRQHTQKFALFHSFCSTADPRHACAVTSRPHRGLADQREVEKKETSSRGARGNRKQTGESQAEIVVVNIK